MIRSFADDDTRHCFYRDFVAKLHGVQDTALRKLLMLDAAHSLEDLRALRGNRLEKLKGKRSGQFSIRINDRWRICFSWRDADAHDVQIVDYH